VTPPIADRSAVAPRAWASSAAGSGTSEIASTGSSASSRSCRRLASEIPAVGVAVSGSPVCCQPELGDHVLTVEVEQWVSAFERERRRLDPKRAASGQELMRMLWRVCRRAGVRNLSPHQLRHGFANRFLRESGRDVVALQALMGHKRPDTTQQYTDDVNVDDLAEVLDFAASSRYAQASPEEATLAATVPMAPKGSSGGGGSRTRVRSRTD
jgi:hypothetical protein